MALLTKIDLLAEARKVISLEVSALKALSESLDHHFEKAVDIIMNVSGRVIISGMGKSGHIGAKIAATFASTGTPSFFLHPGEASHGDLGMITKDDVIICLSNSGETAEISDLIAYSKRYSIPLIAIASSQNSTLAKNSDCALIVPKMPEACPNGLAPTTSTTMMLVLGDALAVAMMRMRGFTSENFLNFHPGGKLGARLLKVSDLMHCAPGLPLVPKEMLLSDVIIEITSKSFGCAGVLSNNGSLVGIITDGDLRRHIKLDSFLNRKACDVMSCKPITLSPEKLVNEAVAIMEKNNITCIFITQDQKPMGIVHIHDCLRIGAS